MTPGRGKLVGGKYRLVEVIGEGAIGVVWRAHDESLGRDVAVKEIRLPSGLDDEQAEALRARTLREARAAARLSHPAIVTVHEVVRQDGRPWIVMELIPGRTLAQVVKEDGPRPPEEVARIGGQILAGLRAAHAAGVIHRDVKPSNVMLDGARTVLTDFGVAALDEGTALTQTGAVLGTPAFMAPEQAWGRDPTPASDLWSLGATMYAAVEGQPPFEGDSVATILMTLLTVDPPEPKRAGPLAPVIAGLLAKAPRLRMSADDAADRLARIAAGEQAAGELVPVAGGELVHTPPARRRRTPGSPRRRRTVIAALAAAFVLTTAAALWLPRRSHPEARPHPAAAGPPVVRLGIHFPSTPIRLDTNVFTVAFSPDGGRLACAGSDGAIRLFDVRTMAQIAQLPGHHAPVEDVRFSPDGRLLASAGDDRTVRLWDLTSRTQVAALTGNRSEVWSVDFSPDGALLASGSKDRTVRVWDVSTHGSLGVLYRSPDAVTAVRFGPDGTTFAAGSRDRTVRLWTTGTWKQRAVLDGHAAAVHSIAFSRDGRTLASGGEDEKVLLWNVGTGLGTGAFTDHTPGEQSLVESVAISPDGRTLASGDADHRIRLYDLRTGTRLAVLDGHTGQVDSVAFSPDGRTLATGAEDRTVRLWDLTR